jgi:hypothetical protein
MQEAMALCDTDFKYEIVTRLWHDGMDKMKRGVLL